MSDDTVLETTSTTESIAAKATERSGLRGRIFLRDPGARIGLIFIVLIALAAITAPWLTPYSPTDQNITDMLQPPSAAHWFGTDEFGRDVLTRILYGARPAFIVGICAVLLSLLIGVPLGMISGYFGNWLDTAVASVVDVMLSFPSLLLALLIVSLIGSSLPVLVLAIGIAHVPIFVRLARSSTFQVRQLDYVPASRTFGTGHLKILRRHILPNIVGPLIVMATLSIAGAIREEAALSFLGLGVQPPGASWGNIIRDGISVIFEAPWMAIIPGLCLTVTVLAFNVVGDTVRDVLDPRDVAASATKKGKS